MDNQHSHHAITWVDREKQNGQKRHRTKASKDKTQSGQTPPKEKIFQYSNNQGVRSHDHMIQGWTINILVMQSRGRTEKCKNGQKRHRTKAPKDKTQSGQNHQEDKIF